MYRTRCLQYSTLYYSELQGACRACLLPVSPAVLPAPPAPAPRRPSRWENPGLWFVAIVESPVESKNMTSDTNLTAHSCLVQRAAGPTDYRAPLIRFSNGQQLCRGHFRNGVQRDTALALHLHAYTGGRSHSQSNRLQQHLRRWPRRGLHRSRPSVNLGPCSSAGTSKGAEAGTCWRTMISATECWRWCECPFTMLWPSQSSPGYSGVFIPPLPPSTFLVDSPATTAYLCPLPETTPGVKGKLNTSVATSCV